MFRQKKYFENYVLTKKYGTSYFYATLLLPKKSRRHIYSLYSLCRYADDLVDVDDDKPGLRKDAKEAINSFYAEVKDSIIKNVKTTEFIDEIAKTWRELDLPIEFLDRFFHSMLMDLEVGKYDTYDDLLVYMDGSAAVRKGI